MQPLFDHSLKTLRATRVATDNFVDEAIQNILKERLYDIKREFKNTEILQELPKDSGRDAALIASVFDIENDVPGALKKVYDSLNPDGLFIAAFVGGETLRELRECLLAAELALTGGAAARIHPMMELRDAAALLQRAGFEMPVADSVHINVTYPSVIHLMRDLRGLNATNILLKRGHKPLSRALLERTEILYREQFTEEDGSLRATLEIMVMTGWKPL